MDLPDQPLTMVREHLNDLPRYDLPEGYTLRWYQPGDEQHWLAIQTAADRYNTITPALFSSQFRRSTAQLEQRQCYLLDAAGAAIGTATAWVDDLYDDPASGRIHWVAIIPEQQGRGLARPMLSAVCQRLVQLQHRRAYLTTSIARLPALQLYRRFGFVPLLEDAEKRALWQLVLQCLQQRNEADTA